MGQHGTSTQCTSIVTGSQSTKWAMTGLTIFAISNKKLLSMVTCTSRHMMNAGIWKSEHTSWYTYSWWWSFCSQSSCPGIPGWHFASRNCSWHDRGPTGVSQEFLVDPLVWITSNLCKGGSAAHRQRLSFKLTFKQPQRNVKWCRTILHPVLGAASAIHLKSVLYENWTFCVQFRMSFPYLHVDAVVNLVCCIHLFLLISSDHNSVYHQEVLLSCNISRNIAGWMR